MKYHIIPVTVFNQNSSLVWCKKTNEAVLIDPGGEVQKLHKNVLVRKLIIKEIWLTHGHLDHVGAASELSSLYNVPIIGPHKDEELLLKMLPEQCTFFNVSNVLPLIPDRWLIDGDILRIGTLLFNVLHCPGHSPGHVIFWNKEKKFIFMGDLLFKGSIGRIDLLGSNKTKLIHSIHRLFMFLTDDVIFLPGHGPISTLGYERLNNPFLKGVNKIQN